MLSESMCDRYVIYRLIAGSEGRCNIQDASEDIGMSSIAECCSRRSVVGWISPVNEIFDRSSCILLRQARELSHSLPTFHCPHFFCILSSCRSRRLRCLCCICVDCHAATDIATKMKKRKYRGDLSGNDCKQDSRWSHSCPRSSLLIIQISVDLGLRERWWCTANCRSLLSQRPRTQLIVLSSRKHSKWRVGSPEGQISACTVSSSIDWASGREAVDWGIRSRSKHTLFLEWTTILANF